jgi:diguanylate cyclase (GGDEF)-like protein
VAGTVRAALEAHFGDPEVLRIAQTAVNPFCAIDDVGTILWAGESVEELLGWPPDKLIGSSMLDIVDPGSLQTALESLGAAKDYVATRAGSAPGWEGVGPVVDLVCADGSTVSCAVAVSTPVRTGLPGFVLQLRRADAHTALEDALVAMSSGDPVSTVLRHMTRMLEGELPDVDVAVAHRCTADDHVEVIGSPAGLAEVFEPGVLGGTPWQVTAEDPDAVVEGDVHELPEPLASAAASAGFRWLTSIGVRAAGPGQHRAFLAVWSRYEHPTHVFSQQRLRRCAGLVGLVVQWEEGRRALEWAATHDGLTGLPNRTAFVGRFTEETRDELTAVLYLDLDDFKPVNDKYGHALGDRVLAEVATRLRHGVRPTDLVARLGGDEFAVLCPSIGTLDAAGLLADRLVEAVGAPLCIDDVEVNIGLSVGIAALIDGDGPDEVLGRADEALRVAKGSGKCGWVLSR